MIIIKRILKLSIIFAIVLTFSSCSISSNINKPAEHSGQSVHVQSPVKLPSIEETVNALCSDEFQGRLVGSTGNDKAVEYIEKDFKNLGLYPLFQGTYYNKYYQDTIGTYGGDGHDAELKMINNVVGVIRGKDSKKAVVISAHLDHIGYQQGKLYRGALDNASGVSALLEIAHSLKEKSKEKLFGMDIVLCAFNGEETGLSGSRAFVSDIKPLYDSLYNINIDCIGAKNGGKLALKNKSKVSDKLYAAVKATMKKNNIQFADTAVIGGSDHMSFENAGIPNVFIIQENIKGLVHKPSDTPDTLNYDYIRKISSALCDFVETNDGIMFASK